MDLSIGADSLLMQTLLSLGVGIGLAAAAGLRVFVPLLVLGAAAHAGWIPLTPGFAWLASPSSLAMLSVATIVEIAAYYVPWVDNLLDVIAGRTRPITGGEDALNNMRAIDAIYRAAGLKPRGLPA